MPFVQQVLAANRKFDSPWHPVTEVSVYGVVAGYVEAWKLVDIPDNYIVFQTLEQV